VWGTASKLQRASHGTHARARQAARGTTASRHSFQTLASSAPAGRRACAPVRQITAASVLMQRVAAWLLARRQPITTAGIGCGGFAAWLLARRQPITSARIWCGESLPGS